MAKEQVIIKPHAGFQEKFVRSNVDVVIGGGVLNPQPIDCLIATPSGFIRMGDIKEGDIICDTKGGTQCVNFVIDKGVQPCVEFTLGDGRKVRSALSHNWQIQDKHGRVRTVTAQHIVDYMSLKEDGSRKNKTNYKIPLCSPAVGTSDNLPIHPYLLGLLIGDGCFSEKMYRPILTTIDSCIVERLTKLGYNVDLIENRDDNLHYYIRNKEVKDYLKDCGLWGLRSYEKFIPNKYLYASVEDRIELLKGLFDADGTCSTTHQVAYGTTSEALCRDIMTLVYSLGGRCSMSKKSQSKREWGNRTSICREAFILYPKLKDDSIFFFLDRKKNRTISDNNRCEKTALTIVSYKMVKPCHMKCINVSGEEHLYLTDNYVITHNCGKTAGAVLMCAEPSQDSRFRGVFLRNNLGDLKSGGGILDEFRSMYRGGVNVVESGDPRVEYPSGARIDVTHIADQNREKVRQRFKGRQYDLIYFDEMTGFTWECFTEVCTRNRGTAKWTGKIRGTTNPERDHWLRVFLDWYIGVDGFIREDREGVVRYFYMAGATVKDVVWGDTKEDCYRQCKSQIDRTLAKINGKNGKATWRDMIKSFTFYLGRMSENKASIDNNSNYVGTVAMSGGANSEQLLEGNWNVSSKDSMETAIPNDMARQVFLNDYATNGDKWITCDLADVGTDNFTAIAWDGFHIYDMLVVGKTTPRQNAELLLNFAKKHDIGPSHIIYDGTRGLYINDYIPEAIPFISAKKACGMYYLEARSLKEECYMRLAEAIKRGEFSIADEVANRRYEHQKVKEYITIQNEFLEECSVVYFVDGGSGKKRLPSKKEMNAKLGKERSMDMLDPCAMRMYPVLEYPYGEELIKTSAWYKNYEDDDDEYDDYGFRKQSVYDDTLWS